jgi:hypothetical protein
VAWLTPKRFVEPIEPSSTATAAASEPDVRQVFKTPPELGIGNATPICWNVVRAGTVLEARSVEPS